MRLIPLVQLIHPKTRTFILGMLWSHRREWESTVQIMHVFAVILPLSIKLHNQQYIQLPPGLIPKGNLFTLE